jgi:hypothetical protein
VAELPQHVKILGWILRNYPAAFLVEAHWVPWGASMGAKEPSREERYFPRDEEIGPDVFEVSGSVKWFEATGSFFRMNTCLTFFCT